MIFQKLIRGHLKPAAGPGPIPRLLWRKPNERTAVGVFFAVLAAAFAMHVLLAPTPWQEGVAAVNRDGQPIRLRNYVTSGVWWSCLVNAAVSLCLALIAPRWMAKSPAPKVDVAQTKPGKGYWFTLAGVLVAAWAWTAYFTTPRLDHSLWYDEAYMVGQSVLGKTKRTSLFGELKTTPASWQTTLWNYNTPNNHVGYSVVARLVHHWLHPQTEGAALSVNETVLRLPAWIAGLTALAALAWMLYALGLPKAALIAPLLVCVHPAFLRYASEARGYAFAFFLAPICVGLMAQAIRGQNWRWWIALGAAELMLVVSSISAVSILVALNLAAVVVMALRRGDERRVLLARWLITNAAAAMVAFVMLFPLYPQFAKYAEANQFPLHARLLFSNMASYLATGIRWTDWEPENPAMVSLSRISEAQSWSVSLLIAAAVLAFAAGCWRLCRKRQGKLLLAAAAFAPLLFALLAVKSGAIFHYWYVVFFLPLTWAVVAVGLVQLCGWLPLARRVPWYGAAALLLAFHAARVTAPQRNLQVAQAIEAARDSVLLTRESLDPFDERADEVMTMALSKPSRIYDPGRYQVTDLSEFLAVVKRAEQLERPLYLNFGMLEAARHGAPEIMRYVDDEKVFETVAVFNGMEYTTTRYVKRYVPGSIKL